VVHREIFTRARNWSRLPSVHPGWDGVPQKILIVNIKNLNKIQRVSLNNVGVVGSILKKLLQTTCRVAGVITRVQLLEGPPQKKFGRAKKVPNFGAIFDNFRLWSRISPERIEISNNWEKLDQPQPVPRWAKKTLVNVGLQTEKFYWLILTNPRGDYSGDYISSHEIFKRARDWPRLPSGHPNWDGGPPKNFNRENVKFGLKFSVWVSITSGLVGISSRNFSRRRAARRGW